MKTIAGLIKKTILLITVIIIHSQCIAQIDTGFSIINAKESLISKDHTFSGFILKMKSGEILHFFRTDPGDSGNHVSNRGGITKRISKDDGQTWSKSEFIYKDMYDDRISSGGILDNGDIIIFFYRFNTTGTWTGTSIDYDYIKSSDGGLTWSQRICTSCNGQEMSYPIKIFKIPTKTGYFCASYTSYYVDIRYSADGYNWDSIYCKWDYRKTKELEITEPSFSYVGDGKIIGIIRVENKSVYQTVSLDYGKTWSKLKATSLANGSFCDFPLNLYDDSLKKVITIVCDRNKDKKTGYINSGVWFYCNNPDSVINNPLGYNNYKFEKRGNPNSYRFLGYPATTKLNDSTYLVLYSDSYSKTNFLEEANFYQFAIHLGIDMYRKRTIQTINNNTFDTIQYSNSDFNPGARSSSNLVVALHSSDTSVASIEQNKIKIKAIGSCIISFTQNGNKDFIPADTVFQELVIKKADQLISFDQLPEQYYPGFKYPLFATANSDLKVSFSSSNEKIAKIINDTLVLLQRGICTIFADQPGNTFFNAAITISKTIDIRDSVPPIVISPNPSIGTIRIQNAKNLPIYIYNISGTMVMNTISNEDLGTIDLSELKSDMYMVIIKEGDKIMSKQKILLVR